MSGLFLGFAFFTGPPVTGRRSPERLRPRAGSRRAPAPLVIELATNAPAAVVAAVEAAIRAVAPLTAVRLVRVRAMTLPRGEQLRIRGPLGAWDARASAGRRQARAMAAFGAALDAALEAARAVADDGGGRL